MCVSAERWCEVKTGTKWLQRSLECSYWWLLQLMMNMCACCRPHVPQAFSDLTRPMSAACTARVMAGRTHACMVCSWNWTKVFERNFHSRLGVLETWVYFIHVILKCKCENSEQGCDSGCSWCCSLMKPRVWVCPLTLWSYRSRQSKCGNGASVGRTDGGRHCVPCGRRAYVMSESASLHVTGRLRASDRAAVWRDVTAASRSLRAWRYGHQRRRSIDDVCCR